jgi:uncharacterized phage protein (TIGR02216 family)
MMPHFPWAELMRLGIGTYHLAPRDFWNCTLRELIPLRGAAGLSRTALDALMARWPD